MNILYFNWIEPIRQTLQKKLLEPGYWEGKQHTHESIIPLRGEQVKRYAVEYVSKEILYYLAHIGT